MNISNELYSSGLLSRNRVSPNSGYEYIGGRKPRWQSNQGHPFMQALERTETSTKVSAIGWRTLKDALR